MIKPPFFILTIVTLAFYVIPSTISAKRFVNKQQKGFSPSIPVKLDFRDKAGSIKVGTEQFLFPPIKSKTVKTDYNN
ncbi:hypothetical protein [Reichenbachiella versicolor]|uniref:hypothetical protein n=1 Tax=Reichenbachiella versicolor TaxID=1821036 RepID=UPI000D6E2667|nr:hypothetical protein [Reichenbachiella versicolor]